MEHGLDVAVHAPRHLLGGALGVEAELDLDVQLAEPLLEAHVRHQAPRRGVVVVLVRPLVHADLAALQVDAARQALRERLALAMLVDRDRGLVAVLDGPDDVLGPERGVAAEEHALARRLERDGVELRHVPLVELDAEVALDPGEGVLLPDREDHVVAGDEDLLDDALARDLGAVHLVLEPLERHALELSALDDEGLRGVVDDDLDLLLLRVLQFPLGGLEEAARLARHDLDALRAEPERGAAAIHGGVADADDEHALADRVDVLEGDRLEPGDADVDPVGVRAAGKAQFLSLGRAGPDEDRVEAAAGEQLAHAGDRRAEPEVRAHVDDVADLLVEHLRRQPERRNVRAHQAAGRRELLEDHDLVADRQQVVRDGERRRAGADAGDALAVLLRRRLRQPRRDVVAQVRGDALQAADRDRLFLDPPAPAGRLARPVADAPEDAREHVRLAVDDVGVRVAALRDQPDVLGHVRVRGTCPLAVHHLVVVVRIRRVGGFHLVRVRH